MKTDSTRYLICQRISNGINPHTTSQFFNKTILIIIALLAYLQISNGQNFNIDKILLIGDSYLYVSNVDSILSSICIENGKNAKVYLSSFPGFSVASHLDKEQINLHDPRKDTMYESNPTIALLTNENWDQIIVECGEPRPNEFQTEIFEPLQKIRKLIKASTKLLLVIPGISDEKYPMYNCGYNNRLSKLDCFKFRNTFERLDTLRSIYNARKNDLDYKYILIEEIISLVKQKVNTKLYVDEDGHPNISLAYMIAYSMYANLFNENNFKTKSTIKKYSIDKTDTLKKINEILKSGYHGY